MSDADDHHPESGKAARAEPIIRRIRDEVEKAGFERQAAEHKGMKWDNARDRRMLRERFDGSAGEAMPPGFGELGRAENARDDCGNPHPFVCDSCGHSIEFGRTCGMSVCARCAQVWVRDAAIQKSAKVRRFRKEKDYAIKGLWQKEHHLVLSPSIGWFFLLASAGFSREEALEITREVVKDILDEFRAQGILVRHSYRGVHDDGSLASETDDQGEWKGRLYAGREWYGDVRDELARKPHYHAVVVSDWIKVKNDEPGELSLTEKVEDATGWVIHRIEDHEGKSLETDGDMARALTYSLSHADIIVNEDGHNRSAVWEVGAFQGDAFKSSGRFTPRPHDLDWADAKVRDISWRILGIRSGTTDCGANLPNVDDPDWLAIKILEELYPDEPETRRQIPADVVLHHVSEGNIDVDVETSSGGGGSITVRSAFGVSSSAGSVELPSQSSTWSVPEETAGDPVEPDELRSVLRTKSQDHSDDCGCEDDNTCNGTLIPLDEARRRGLLEDDEWLGDAAHVDEALRAHREWPEDLDPWRAESPGKASPAIG